jgi:hypothetical protein
MYSLYSPRRGCWTSLTRRRPVSKTDYPSTVCDQPHVRRVSMFVRDSHSSSLTVLLRRLRSAIRRTPLVRDIVLKTLCAEQWRKRCRVFLVSKRTSKIVQLNLDKNYIKPLIIIIIIVVVRVEMKWRTRVAEVNPCKTTGNVLYVCIYIFFIIIFI